MKLYIPEIGDEIELTQDWTFTLHAEHRNTALAAYFGHYYGCGAWVDEQVVPLMREVDYEVKYPERPVRKQMGLFSNFDKEWDKYVEAYRKAELDNPQYVQYQKDYDKWLKQVSKHGKESITVTIPAGTILKVDRIYIRKGISDYSSITFFAKNLGVTEVASSDRWRTGPKKAKKTSLRFWAKLNECNNIECERVCTQ